MTDMSSHGTLGNLYTRAEQIAHQSPFFLFFSIRIFFVLFFWFSESESSFFFLDIFLNQNFLFFFLAILSESESTFFFLAIFLNQIFFFIFRFLSIFLKQNLLFFSFSFYFSESESLFFSVFYLFFWIRIKNRTITIEIILEIQGVYNTGPGK